MRKKINTLVSRDCFVFNLGRLWQEVISDRWDKAIYLFELIKEVTPLTVKRKHLKELKNLWLAIENRDCGNVDKALERVLKW